MKNQKLVKEGYEYLLGSDNVVELRTDRVKTGIAECLFCECRCNWVNVHGACSRCSGQVRRKPKRISSF